MMTEGDVSGRALRGPPPPATAGGPTAACGDPLCEFETEESERGVTAWAEGLERSETAEK